MNSTPAAETAMRRQIIETAIEMERLGINQGTSGNISARWQDGLLITPSGVPYAELQTQDIVWLPLNVADDAEVFQASHKGVEGIDWILPGTGVPCPYSSCTKTKACQPLTNIPRYNVLR